jgi:hypothetical protein
MSVSLRIRRGLYKPDSIYARFAELTPFEHPRQEQTTQWKVGWHPGQLRWAESIVISGDIRQQGASASLPVLCQTSCLLLCRCHPPSPAGVQLY